MRNYAPSFDEKKAPHIFTAKQLRLRLLLPLVRRVASRSITKFMFYLGRVAFGIIHQVTKITVTVLPG